MTCRDVMSFVIVPPPDNRGSLTQQEKLIDLLLRKFPGYSFRVTKLSPVGHGPDFGVYPVMNFLGPDGEMLLCTEPKSWLIAGIREACSRFMKTEALAA